MPCDSQSDPLPFSSLPISKWFFVVVRYGPGCPTGHYSEASVSLFQKIVSHRFAVTDRVLSAATARHPLPYIEVPVSLAAVTLKPPTILEFTGILH